MYGGGGAIDDFSFAFNRLRTASAEVLMYLDTPMPYIFAHLMTIICKTNLFLTSVNDKHHHHHHHTRTTRLRISL